MAIGALAARRAARGGTDGAGGSAGEGRLEHQRAEPDLDEHSGEVAAAMPELPADADGIGEEAVSPAIVPELIESLRASLLKAHQG